MKNTSRLKLLAAVVLQVVLLTLPASAFAAAADNQEIGETYDNRMYEKDGLVDSATLAPSGDRLYTLKDGILRQYSLSPLRKINAITVEFDSRKTSEGHYQTFITNDEKRIVIYGRERLRLLDLQTGKLIKTVPFQSVLGVLNNDDIFTLDNDNKATVWNALDLTKKREFVATGEERWSFKEHEVNIERCSLIKVADHIVMYRPAYVSGNGKVFVFDGASYRQIWNVGNADATPSVIAYDLISLSTPLGKLWNGHSGQYVNPSEEDIKKFKEARFGVNLKVTIATAQVEYIPHNPHSRLHRAIFLWRGASEQQISPTRQYHVVRHSVGTHYAFFYREDGTPRQPKLLLQFEDGEVALMGRDGGFLATENARKHMKMKNKQGEYVPINDATFQKFNKAGSDHKEW